MNFTIEEFESAYSSLKKYLIETPLIKNEWMSQKYQANIYLKLENLQPVGSFKLRGALYKIMSLSEEDRQKGVVAVSAGNHAQGVAWAARRFGIPATIIMPKPSPLVKIANTEALGAKVILEGQDVDESFEFVLEYLKTHDQIYIHPFNDKDIILGQGSIAMELKEQLDSIDFLFGSIGGGGKLSGVGFVTKAYFPGAKVVASQAMGASSMVQSLQSGQIVETAKTRTFADGIKVQKARKDMFELLDNVVDEVIAIEDQKIAGSVLDLIEQARVVAEGAAAINLAAFKELYDAAPRRFKNKNIVILICGGNIDINVVDRIIDKGLIESKRRIQLTVVINDTPGELTLLTQRISETSSNILQVLHDRNSASIALNQSLVEVTLETRGSEHARDVMTRLKEFYEIRDNS